jgi:tripartite-type tricarboxylate transporter receptor subunit TctC
VPKNWEDVVRLISGVRIICLACMLAVTAGIASAVAQSWPTRFVTLVVPFGAGSAADTVARILAGRLSEVLGQQMIVENVFGGGRMVGINRRTATTSRLAASAPLRKASSCSKTRRCRHG